MLVSIVFPESQHCMGCGRENCKQFSKKMYCFMRAPSNYRKLWILHYCLNVFCPGLQFSLNDQRRSRKQTFVTETPATIGQLHEEDIWLQLPEFISVLLCYLNLSIPLRIKEQENNKLKYSGSCSTKMTSSCNCPISAEHKQRENQNVPRVRYTKVGRQALFAGQCKSG